LRFVNADDYANLPALAVPHFQFLISGRSSPFLSM
jgi:hypothetical protein